MVLLEVTPPPPPSKVNFVDVVIVKQKRKSGTKLICISLKIFELSYLAQLHFLFELSARVTLKIINNGPFRCKKRQKLVFLRILSKEKKEGSEKSDLLFSIF